MNMALTLTGRGGERGSGKRSSGSGEVLINAGGIQSCPVRQLSSSSYTLSRVASSAVIDALEIPLRTWVSISTLMADTERLTHIGKQYRPYRMA
jgi:hypothetical protein